MTGEDIPRCRWAIRYGTTLATRCLLPEGHAEVQHEGRGLEAFAYQRVTWIAGDRREYRTERTDVCSWEEEVPLPTTVEERNAARVAVRAMLHGLGVPEEEWPPEVRWEEV